MKKSVALVPKGFLSDIQPNWKRKLAKVSQTIILSNNVEKKNIVEYLGTAFAV